MSQATHKHACDISQDQVTRRLQNGCRFFHIGWQNATVVFLARNSSEAFGLFRLWLGFNSHDEPRVAERDCAIVEITDTTPPQFGVYGGRRDGKAQIRVISINN